MSEHSFIIFHLQIAHKKTQPLDVLLEQRGWLLCNSGCGQGNLSKGISINDMIGAMKEGAIFHRLFVSILLFKVERSYIVGKRTFF